MTEKDIESRLTAVESNMTKLKRQMTRTTRELKTMDRMILDEVERVHAILTRHTQDKTVHTA